MSGMGEVVAAELDKWVNADGFVDMGVSEIPEATREIADAIAAHLAEVAGDDDLWEAVWIRIAELRDAKPRTTDDADSGEIADAVLAVVTEALTGHPARSGGAEGADLGRVALGEGGEVCGAQSGSEAHEWVGWPRTLLATEVVMQCTWCGVRSRRQVEGEVWR